MMQTKPVLSIETLPDAKALISSDYRWSKIQYGQGECYGRGHARQIFEGLKAFDNTYDIENVAEILSKTKEFSGGILSSPFGILAWVDHIRSYPVYYCQKNGQLIVSNSARAILNEIEGNQEDEESALEFAMAGFVTGRNTLYRNIYCLMPGECLVYEAESQRVIIKRYFEYLPKPLDSAWDKNRTILSDIIDSIIQKIIKRAAGQPIWVPLSAGLDSRLILCKLHEHGYKNLHTFTYGPRFNFEALHAKRIAETLKMPWHFIGISMKDCRAAFEDPERSAYSDYADGLKAAPSFREYTAIKYLKDNKMASDDAIFINGQSGDYITGGHVSSLWYENRDFDCEDLINVLIKKHYSLWNALKTNENLSAIKEKIISVLPAHTAETGFDFAALEENWEYDARQITLVVNGQRSYEFFGYEWELPLWEREFVDFCETLPFEQKRNQVLFKAYLKNYNYKGLFPSREPVLWRWPLPMLWVIPLARVLGLASGTIKNRFYALMRYYGHYSNQYAFFPLSLHWKTCRDAKNIFSLYVRLWFEENNYSLSPKIKSVLRYDEAQ